MPDTTKTKTCPTGQVLKSGKCVNVKKVVKKSGSQKAGVKGTPKVTWGEGGKVTARIGVQRKEGLRFYEGSATKRNPSLSKQSAIGRARFKAQQTPADSVRFTPPAKVKEKTTKKKKTPWWK